MRVYKSNCLKYPKMLELIKYEKAEMAVSRQRIL